MKLIKLILDAREKIRRSLGIPDYSRCYSSDLEISMGYLKRRIDRIVEELFYSDTLPNREYAVFNKGGSNEK